ncbi:MAG: hypothetical protein LBQ07_01495 [Endomicrobium sp.]|jgi:hypothetical protein|nr:hypothetical protein [Endomicrobium sp.]
MIKVPEVKVRFSDLLTRLGYLKFRTRVNKRIVILMEDLLNFAQKLIRPKVMIAFENIELTKNEIFFENGYKIKSSDVAAMLKNSFKAYGITATIGNMLEYRRKKFSQNGNIFNALILDTIGSIAVEETIKLVNLQIKNYEKKNNNILTKRYSPGYGDWTLEFNKHLLDWIGANCIGIELNECYQMSPEKSISALIGVEKL